MRIRIYSTKASQTKKTIAKCSISCRRRRGRARLLRRIYAFSIQILLTISKIFQLLRPSKDPVTGATCSLATTKSERPVCGSGTCFTIRRGRVCQYNKHQNAMAIFSKNNWRMDIPTTRLRHGIFWPRSKPDSAWIWRYRIRNMPGMMRQISIRSISAARTS